MNSPLNRSDNYVVDRDEDELNEEPNKSHHHETNRRTNRYLREFCKREK